VHIIGDQERVLLLVRVLVGHVHRLGSGGGLVQQRRIRHGHARQISDQGLVVEQHLHTTLGNLGLLKRRKSNDKKMHGETRSQKKSKEKAKMQKLQTSKEGIVLSLIQSSNRR
jgi:hypothetical protein